MQIELKTLFIYRQYVDYPMAYYFDRKTYNIVDAAASLELTDETYERCIPLFQIDEEALQDEFILQLNNKKILSDYRQRTVCFGEFIDKRYLGDSWWRFYEGKVYEAAADWCQKNNIKYREHT